MSDSLPTSMYVRHVRSNQYRHLFLHYFVSEPLSSHYVQNAPESVEPESMSYRYFFDLMALFAPHCFPRLPRFGCQALVDSANPNVRLGSRSWRLWHVQNTLCYKEGGYNLLIFGRTAPGQSTGSDWKPEKHKNQPNRASKYHPGSNDP